ncbi:MAG: ATPase [Flavobacteriaceae bacterium]|nr:ATPase [Flavobacteriaceae bacterium]
MIAIADGGATKCDWVLLDNQGNEILKTNTIGFNPNVIRHDLITEELLKNEDLTKVKEEITQLYFYGAGCGFKENQEVLKNELQKVFANAEIIVKEDLIAAAYAAYQAKPAIVCILGTGSNSCLFDGETLHRELPSLGHLIGDEGSGGTIGKALLRNRFMKKLPKDLEQEFDEVYGITAGELVQTMYSHPRVNTYLADFNRFVADRKSHPYFQNMVYEELKKFVEYHILPYPQCFSCEVNFVGSIAFIYQDILNAVASHYRLNIGTIVQKPIENLINYHRKYILKLH